jgi:hypothetical protein
MSYEQYKHINAKGTDTIIRDKTTTKAVLWTLEKGINETTKGKIKPGMGTGLQ